MLRSPEVVRSLALIAPLVPDFAPSEAVRGSFREIASAARTMGLQRAMRAHWLPHPLLASAAGIPGVRERLEGMVNGFPGGEYFAASRDAFDRDWKVTDRLGEIGVPTLVVSGERDIPDFSAMAALLAEGVPESVLEIVPECGHLVPLERPKETTEALLRFFRVQG
jgi:pimeloyl-ACP methyl ester carboxylesterase